jgi:NADPH-dependent 2,4-dienoyl-CoA reductase/sulfur reductase-like enzyme/rhodanese-related sulfurtransferase
MQQPKSPKKIVIVGAVAGGMSAATRARRLDETAIITVFDQGSYASFATCGLPYALGNVIPDDSTLELNTPKSFKARFNIDVQVHSEVVSIDRKKKVVGVREVGKGHINYVEYDKLILSQGAEAIRPPIDGANLDHVYTLQTIPDLRSIKARLSHGDVKRVCVIGAGLVGLEAVENIRHRGLKVSVVEFLPQILSLIDADMAEILHTELQKRGVKLYLSSRADFIARDRVLLQDGTEIPAELVVLAIGARPRTLLAKNAGLELGKTGVTVNDYMQTSDPDIYAVGDMVETEHRIAGTPMNVPLAGPANRQGRLAVDHIYGKDIRYRGNIGTSILQVFSLTVSFVGLSIATLRRMGYNPLWITVHPPDHATYYPGAHQMTLKLAFSRDGIILGAQAIGQSGVDKRIDVLATAMQNDMAVFDLEHLELAYAPPYNSAKDPVNMAGFVASNLLRGDYQMIHAEDLVSDTQLENLQIVDVRSPDEYARGHIIGAINLPINSLREELFVLDKSCRTLVYCQVGYRGYLGYRILKQHGFDVVNLDGGFKSVVEGGFRSVTKCCMEHDGH